MPQTVSHDMEVEEKYGSLLTRQPKGTIAKIAWRVWVWISTTFALSMTETWEHLIVFVVVGSILSLLSVGLFSYFPHYAVAAVSRAQYYLYGTDSVGKEFVMSRSHGIEL